MGTHQAHNIPWHVLGSVYVAEAEYWRFEGGGKTGGTILRPRRDWEPQRLLKALRHFARRLAATVKEFANTELVKYEQRPQVPRHWPLYGEEEFDKVVVGGKYQEVEYWLERQRRYAGAGCGDWQLAEVAKRLLNRGMVEALVRLVRAGVRLDRLAVVDHCGDGIRRVMEEGLELYIYLNLALVKGLAPLWPERPPAQLRRLRDDTFRMRWYFEDAQRVAFFKALAALPGEEQQELAAARLHATFLGDLFRRLYQYRMLMAACGFTDNWELAVFHCLPRSFGPLQRILWDYTSQLPHSL
ncbi:hypothetical protein L7F22_010620 [Adiantum nelumboides]|nr:hypothetical protein [Adiantum nelumboides]